MRRLHEGYILQTRGPRAQDHTLATESERGTERGTSVREREKHGDERERERDNFWATWCAPCKKEMPSLDLLKSHNELDNLEIFPINVGKENVEKASNFLTILQIFYH